MTEKYSLTPRLSDLRNGDRFVVDAWFKYSPQGEHERRPRAVATLHSAVPLSEVPTWKEIGPDGPYAVDTQGNRYEVVVRDGRLALTEGGRTRHALWTRPVPDLPDEDVFAYVEAFLGKTSRFAGLIEREDPYAPNCVFRIERLEAKHAVGRMVSWASDTQDDYLEYLDRRTVDEAAFPNDYAFHFVEDLDAFLDKFSIDGRLAVSNFEVRIPRKNLPEATSSGSLVTGASFWVNVVDGVEITKVSMAAVAGTLDLHTMEAYLPWRSLDRPSIVRRSHDGLELATIQDWLKEAARAKAKLDPDEILLAVLPKDMDEPSYGSSTVLPFGSRGAVFFEHEAEWLDDVAFKDPGPGLWMFREVRPWSHRDAWTGEWDGGIDGKWEPATLDDVRLLGNDPEAMAAEIADNYEGADYEASVAAGTFLDDLMRLSREACSGRPKAPV